MAELIGRKAIAEFLEVSGGEVAMLRKITRAFPVRLCGRKYVTTTEALEAGRWTFRKTPAVPGSGKVE